MSIPKLDQSAHALLLTRSIGASVITRLHVIVLGVSDKAENGFFFNSTPYLADLLQLIYTPSRSLISAQMLIHVSLAFQSDARRSRVSVSFFVRPSLLVLPSGIDFQFLSVHAVEFQISAKTTHLRLFPSAIGRPRFLSKLQSISACICVCDVCVEDFLFFEWSGDLVYSPPPSPQPPLLLCHFLSNF